MVYRDADDRLLAEQDWQEEQESSLNMSEVIEQSVWKTLGHYYWKSVIWAFQTRTDLPFSEDEVSRSVSIDDLGYDPDQQAIVRDEAIQNELATREHKGLTTRPPCAEWGRYHDFEDCGGCYDDAEKAFYYR